MAGADTTAVVAVYAALVATAGLAWQIVSWSREHGTRIRVEHSRGFMAASPTVSMAIVTVYNRSNHAVEIQGIGWVLGDGSVPILAKMAGATLPGPVAPHSQGMSWIPADGLAATLREQGKPEGTKLRAYATDGEGRRHLSDAFPSW